jgi:hypothetical protein
MAIDRLCYAQQVSQWLRGRLGGTLKNTFISFGDACALNKDRCVLALWNSKEQKGKSAGDQLQLFRAQLLALHTPLPIDVT